MDWNTVPPTEKQLSFAKEIVRVLHLPVNPSKMAEKLETKAQAALFIEFYYNDYREEISRRAARRLERELRHWDRYTNDYSFHPLSCGPDDWGVSMADMGVYAWGDS